MILAGYCIFCYKYFVCKKCQSKNGNMSSSDLGRILHFSLKHLWLTLCITFYTNNIFSKTFRYKVLFFHRICCTSRLMYLFAGWYWASPCSTWTLPACNQSYNCVRHSPRCSSYCSQILTLVNSLYSIFTMCPTYTEVI